MLKARNAERDSVFSGVMALVVYIALTAAAVMSIGFAVNSFGGLDPELGVVFYFFAVSFCLFEIAIVLVSTLPPESFDFDLALDDRRGVRRAFLIAAMLITGLLGTDFPHVTMLGALGFLIKLIWDESVAGCCRCGARKKQHEAAGEATGFHDEQGRRVHNPTDAGCGARFRPRLSDTICLCYFGTLGLHMCVQMVLTGLCHAAAQGPGVAVNTSTSNDANWATTIDASFLNSIGIRSWQPHNRSTLGNVTNATSITCGGDSFKYV